jgi:hypothetical protein
VFQRFVRICEGIERILAKRMRGKRTGKNTMIPQSHPLKRIDDEARNRLSHPSEGKGDEAMIRRSL